MSVVSGPESPASPWLSVPAAAAFLSVGRRTIYSAVTAGRLRATAVNDRGDLRIHRDWIDAWLNAPSQPAASPEQGDSK